jgi:hypothetical protein
MTKKSVFSVLIVVAFAITSVSVIAPVAVMAFGDDGGGGCCGGGGSGDEGDRGSKNPPNTFSVPPSCTLTGSPSTIDEGDSATLRWSSSHASMAWLTGFNSVSLNGSRSVSPHDTKTYTLTVYGNGKTATCHTTITVRHIQVNPSCTIYANPTSINEGQSSTITWNSTNADSATLSSFGSVSLNGSKNVSPSNTTTYTLTVRNDNGKTATCDTTVVVKKQQNLWCTISANPSQIERGNSSTLSWNSSSNATSAELSDFGSVSVDGSRSVSPDSTRTYTLTIHDNQGRTANCETTITVHYNQPNAPYCTLSASNVNNNYNNQSALLTWTSYNATSATISPELGNVSLNGSQTVYPHGAMTYVMTVTGPGGTNTCQVSVQPVQQNLSCTLTVSPNTIPQGGNAFLTWSSSGAVNAFISDGIGNVAPNGSITVRPSTSRQFTLTVTDGFGRTQNCTTYITVNGVYVPPPQLPYVTLTQIPYTGLDGDAMYFGSIVAFAGAAAYLLYYYKFGRRRDSTAY